MATLNTTSIPTQSSIDASDFESTIGQGNHENLITPKGEWEDVEDDEPETINDEFLNDDIFGDEPDDNVQRENVSAKGTDDSETGVSGTSGKVADVDVHSVDESAKSSSDASGGNSDLSGDQPVQSNDGVREATESPTRTPFQIELDNAVKYIPPEWNEEAEKRKDETAFFTKLKELNVAIDSAEADLAEAKEEVKLAKATLNLAIANQKHFTSKGVQYRKRPEPPKLLGPNDEHPRPSAEHLEQAVATADLNLKQGNIAPVETPAAAQIPESEWRAWETATIMDGIEGLGAKKRETLIEHFPTFGKLMDARTEAGKEHVSFHSLLPKGIGESIATELINRMDAKIVPGM